MKTLRYVTLMMLSCFSLAASAQEPYSTDSTGLPGDHFSLEGALELFKKAGSPEAFEKLLNTEGSHVNNLDLNADGAIDYIRVVSKMENDVHIFILQVPVSANESQDIAVIELEKTGNETAIIQIVGDEDIYGEETVIEPQGEDDQAFLIMKQEESLRSGPYNSTAGFIVDENRGVIVNVWFWPPVRFVYAPGYRPWVSPWRWRAYPAWFRPWRPLGWTAFRAHRIHYHRGFVVAHTARIVRARRIYAPVRVTSVSVRTRHAVAVNNYRVTRTRTTVTGPRGNTVTRKTTTVTGKRGKVKVSKTKVRKRRGG